MIENLEKNTEITAKCNILQRSTVPCLISCVFNKGMCNFSQFYVEIWTQCLVVDVVIYPVTGSLGDIIYMQMIEYCCHLDIRDFLSYICSSRLMRQTAYIAQFTRYFSSRASCHIINSCGLCLNTAELSGKIKKTSTFWEKAVLLEAEH
jgi:hypothetical protein